MAVTLIYETHSVTTDNEAGIATGWLPGALSVRGRELAEELGERHRDSGVAAVFCSDLRRAVETAEIAFAGTAIPVRQDTRLRECNYGDLNGMPVARLHPKRARHIDVSWPGGEAYAQVVVRTRSFLTDLVDRHDGERVVVIAHSANRWALDHLVHGRDLADLIEAPFEWREGWFYVVERGFAT